jgi:predicted acylesterase/phospholipase RssA
VGLLAVLGAVALAAAVWGYFNLRSTALLDYLNQPQNWRKLDRTPTAQRVERIAFTHLADAYANGEAVAGYLDAIAKDPSVLLEQYACVAHGEDGSDRCYARFDERVLPAVRRDAQGLSFGQSSWKLPDPPICLMPPLDGRPGRAERGKPVAPPRGACPGPYEDGADVSAPAPEWIVSFPGLERSVAELDSERLAANARGVAAALAELANVMGEPLEANDLGEGLVRGLEHAAKYVRSRRVHRDPAHPVTALVMSGGSANGAFSAGFVSRIFDVVARCRDEAAPRGCPDARLDLAVGTSTGALVGVLVDLFSVAGQRKCAHDLLQYEYTCSTASDLYTPNDVFGLDLISGHTKGLVHFGGIENKLLNLFERPDPAGGRTLGDEMVSNALELVTVSARYESGDLFADSDQDPEVAVDPKSRARSVLASIVEPILADPVDSLPRVNQNLTGTFLDGGIRSPLSLMEAVRRGAERVVMLANSGIEPDPIPDPRNALGILLRSLSLSALEPLVSEVSVGEFAAIARRLTEYGACTRRFRKLVLESAEEDAMRAFCRRERPPARAGRRTLAGTADLHVGPGLFEEVSQSWQTTWVYRSESNQAEEQNYDFNPQVMRPIYLDGVRAYQKRCRQVNRLLGITGEIADAECNDPDAERRIQSSFEGLCRAGPEPTSCGVRTTRR